MPRVFTGKVVIPGDQFDDYLQALEAATEARAPFKQYMGLSRDMCKIVQEESEILILPWQSEPKQAINTY